MIKYKSIYSFQVFNEIADGKTVYVIDKSLEYNDEAICIANDMAARDLMQIIAHDNKDGRFDFFEKEEVEDNETEK